MKGFRFRLSWRYLPLLGLTSILSGCFEPPWNSPYPVGEAGENVYYSSFEERPKHLDPARSYSSNEWAFISQIYEPPLQYHFLKRPYQLTTLAADTMPEVIQYDSGNNVLGADAPVEQVAYTDYVIRIQEGIRYQPHPALAKRGEDSWWYWPLSQAQLEPINRLADFEHVGTREATAEDYVYQIKRLAFLPNHSPIAGHMSKHIQGFKEFSQTTKAVFDDLKAGSGDKTPWLDLRQYSLSGLEVVDRYTYRVRVNRKYPQFIYWLAMNFFAPMPWEAERFYAQPGMKRRNITLHWYPIGTGPYMLTENNPNLRMVLERNPNFRGERYPESGDPEDAAAGLLDDAGQTMPFIDKAVYSLEKESIPRWNKFLQGYYDSSGIGSDSFDQAVQFGSAGEPELTPEMKAQGIQLNTAVEATLFYTGFNMRDDVVGGDSERARLLRRAIAIAVDIEEFVSIFRNGRGEAAQGPLPPGIFGYRSGPDGVNPYLYEWRDGKPRRKSIEHARQLLTQAGYPDGRDPNTGRPLILNYDTPASGPDSKALLDWYRLQLEKLGIQLLIRATDYNRFQSKMLNGTAQIYTWGWHADYPDPENFLFLLYGPNGKVEHKGENASNYANAEFDRLFNVMKDMPNGPERLAVIDEMVEILRRDSPWLFGFFPKAFGLHHEWYSNTKPHLIANNTLKYKRIDPALRVALQSSWNEPVTWPLWLGLIVLLISITPAVIGFRRRERSLA